MGIPHFKKPPYGKMAPKTETLTFHGTVWKTLPSNAGDLQRSTQLNMLNIYAHKNESGSSNPPKDRTWVYCVYTHRNLMMSCCLQCTYISLLIWGSISPCKLEKQSLLIWSDHALLFYIFQFQGCILHDNRHTTKTSDLHRYCLRAMPWDGPTSALGPLLESYIWPLGIGQSWYISSVTTAHICVIMGFNGTYPLVI